MISLIITSLLLAATFAKPAPRASQLQCSIVNTNSAEYLVLEPVKGSSPANIPGVYSNYTLSDALKAAGSNANPGTNPEVLVNTFETSFGQNSNLYA